MLSLTIFPIHSLFLLSTPTIFHSPLLSFPTSTPTSFSSPSPLPPPPSLSLSLSLSPTIFTPPYSLFSHPHTHQFSPPSHSLSLPPLPPFFTLLTFPTPTSSHFPPTLSLPPPLSYPPNCQYTLAYGLNDLCTEVSAELFKAGFK